MGIAQKVRAAGLPADYPMDIFIVLALDQPPLVHTCIRRSPKPCADMQSPGCLAAARAYQLISQYTLEPLLKSVAETFPRVTVRYGCEFLAFEQDAIRGDRKKVKSSGDMSAVRAAYLVGCDGGASPVRRQLGIKLAAKPISSTSARRSITAKNSTSAFQSAKGATITSRMPKQAS